MPSAGGKAAVAEYRAVIYLRGTPDADLSDAEQRCREYADRFGWLVVESIRDQGGSASSLRRLAPKMRRLGIQIIVTDTLDMISPDKDARDNLMMEIERSQCIVHPVSTPCRT